MTISLLAIAFAAGILSFLSPCIIPMLGVYFSLITGLSSDQLKETAMDALMHRRVVKNTLAFIGGFALVFTAAGAAAGELGAILSKWQFVLNILGGTVVLILALKLLGVFKLSFLAKLHWEPAFYEKLRNKAKHNAWSSFIVGLLFAVACSHCIGPTLYSILALAGTTQNPFSGMLVMFVFSLGLAIPYMIAGLSFNWIMKSLQKIRHWQFAVERLAGLLMLYISYVIYADKLTQLTGYLAKVLPRLPLGM
ncbi:cytochrome c biogenesis protein [Desulfosporosinus acidiphilus SJ4]|uniref:Cytochrome c biogenesis protein n=1 Tax=Desulfosporosinus acidiphilus (strain DSM 22704 / JCM 16185 / SJ4) TaxID=646529 RepID=I4DAG4_DESAJ|nr:cytochrome c biogenesis protein CcdA [Desulfosporosinus acidiphilus]AFM42788.1 cytochrome c biogenesis protein [Desulfosporosinus acidiphilus SJ4]